MMQMQKYHTWLVVAKNGVESITWSIKPIRDENSWVVIHHGYLGDKIHIKKGSVEKMLGRKMTWEDEPVMWDVDPDEYNIEV